MLEYVFEPMSDGMYQVRLEGYFVVYVDKKDPELVDQLLQEAGYTDRQEFLDSRIEGAKRWFKENIAKMIDYNK